MRVMLAAVLLAVVSMVHGWPTGADPGRCGNMLPGHGTEQNGDNPHSMTASGTEYSPGETVDVTISGDIRGLLLQARKADGSSTTPYGTFSVSSNDAVKLMECTAANDAVTHSSTDVKTNLKVTWTAPSSDVGNLKFVATVLEAKETWWMNLESSALSYTGTDGGDGTDNGSTTVSATSFLIASVAAICLLKLLP